MNIFQEEFAWLGITSASIGADGQLRPCGHAHLTYGNVYTEGIKTPWKKMKDWRERKYSGKCVECKYFDLCTGGCPIDNLNSKRGLDCHVTCKEDVIYKKKKIKKPPISTNQFFYIPKTVLIREESFGALMSTKTGIYLLIDRDTYSLVKNMKKMNLFSVASLCKKFDINQDEILFFLQNLYIKKLILEGGENNDHQNLEHQK